MGLLISELPRQGTEFRTVSRFLQDVTLRPETGDLFLQRCNLGQFRASLAIVAGNAVVGVAAASRIQRRSTLSARSRSRHACATATPRSLTSFTASILNSRLNFRLVISTLQFNDHDLVFVSTKPAAGQGADMIRPPKQEESQISNKGNPTTQVSGRML